jgi:hypothetical protein
MAAKTPDQQTSSQKEPTAPIRLEVLSTKASTQKKLRPIETLPDGRPRGLGNLSKELQDRGDSL